MTELEYENLVRNATVQIQSLIVKEASKVKNYDNALSFDNKLETTLELKKDIQNLKNYIQINFHDVCKTHSGLDVLHSAVNKLECYLEAMKSCNKIENCNKVDHSQNQMFLNYYSQYQQARKMLCDGLKLKIF
jgi:hypothetical protein